MSDSSVQSNTDAARLPRVVAVIVAFNSGAWLEQAVASVLESTVRVSVIVSDNASSDDSISRVRDRWGEDARVRILAHGRNLGFATAVNRPLAPSTEPAVLLLNPDCLVQPEMVEGVLAALNQDPGAGMPDRGSAFLMAASRPAAGDSTPPRNGRLHGPSSAPCAGWGAARAV